MSGQSNEIIHQTLRLKIMAALTALPDNGDGLDFSHLKKSDRGDGRQSRRGSALEKAGYVVVQKSFVERKPRTTVHG